MGFVVNVDVQASTWLLEYKKDYYMYTPLQSLLCNIETLLNSLHICIKYQLKSHGH